MIQLNLYLSENEKTEGKPSYQRVVDEARQLKINGASIFRTTENYGHTGEVHTESLLELGSHQSVMVVMIAERDAIQQLIQKLKELKIKGFTTTHEVVASPL